MKGHGITSPGTRGEPHDDEVKPSGQRDVKKPLQRAVIEKARGKMICWCRRLQERTWCELGNELKPTKAVPQWLVCRLMTPSTS